MYGKPGTKHGRMWNTSPGRGILLGNFWFKDTASRQPTLKAHCADTASEISDATQLRDDGSRVPWSTAFCTGESTIPPNLKTDALLNDSDIHRYTNLLFFATFLQKFCHCNLQRESRFRYDSSTFVSQQYACNLLIGCVLSGLVNELRILMRFSGMLWWGSHGQR